MNMENTMDFPCQVESGLQLLSRLTTRPGLGFVHQELFQNGPKFNEVIEIIYDLNTHHCSLICEILCNVLLPEELGGKNAGIVVILTDGHFDLIQLIAVLSFIIKQRSNSQEEGESATESIVNKCLENITILHVYDSQQMTITIQNLENILSSDANISLVMVDTISAFYWADRMANPSLLKMDTYVKKVLKCLQSATKEYKSVIVYTRPSYFISKVNDSYDKMEGCVEGVQVERVNWRITLSASETDVQRGEGEGDVVNVSVATSKNTLIKNFVVRDLEITWI